MSVCGGPSEAGETGGRADQAAVAALRALYDATVEALAARRLAALACAGGAVPRPAPGGRLVLFGLGKIAVELMAGAVDALGELEDHAVAGVAAAPEGAPTLAGVRVLRGGHPLPTQGSLDAGAALLEQARALGPRDAALLLLSGGGSALADVPAPGLDISDLRALNQALLVSGAPIEEMNWVRAHLSAFKGGGLARALWSAGVRRALALVAVDVPSGALASVSSGPALPDPSRFEDALRVVRARQMRLPATALSALEEGAQGLRAETLKQGEDAAGLVQHRVLCDLRSPVREALRAALWPAEEACGPGPVHGPLENFAVALEARLAQWTAAAGAGAGAAQGPGSAPLLLAASGEVELRVPDGAPPGGRAQHLALRMARALRGRDAAFMAAGTDGRDGATDAAGAAVTGATWDEAVTRGLDPAGALERGAASDCLRALGATMPARQTGAHAGELYLLLLGASGVQG